jgi:hypothetical protein
MRETSEDGSHLPVSIREGCGILAILAVFILVESILVSHHLLPYADVETDTFGYLEAARGPLLRVHDYQPPGYSLALRVFSQLFGLDAFSAGKVVSIFSGILFLLSGWRLFRSMVPPLETLFATALLGFQHLVLFYSCAVLSDVMASALFLACLALLVPASQPRGGLHFLAGLIGGASYLTRYAFVILIALPILTAIGHTIRARNQFSRHLYGIVFFLAGFALVNLPWWAFLYAETGHPFWSKSYLVVAHHIHGEGHPTTFASMDSQFSGLGQVFLSDPARFLQVVMGTMAGLPARWENLFPSFLLLAMLGAPVWLWRMNPMKAIFATVTLAYTLLACLVHFEGRYFIPVIPLLSSFVAAAVIPLPRILSERVLSGQESRGYRDRTLAVVGIGFLWLTISHSKNWLEHIFREEEPVEYRTLARGILVKSEVGDRLIAAKPHVAFWSGSEFLSLRQDVRMDSLSAETLPDRLLASGATLFLFDERVAARSWPGFAWLLDPQDERIPDILTPWIQVDEPMRAVLYRIEHPGSSPASGP